MRNSGFWAARSMVSIKPWLITWMLHNSSLIVQSVKTTKAVFPYREVRITNLTPNLTLVEVRPPTTIINLSRLIDKVSLPDNLGWSHRGSNKDGCLMGQWTSIKLTRLQTDILGISSQAASLAWLAVGLSAQVNIRTMMALLRELSIIWTKRFNWLWVNTQGSYWTQSTILWVVLAPRSSVQLLIK